MTTANFEVDDPILEPTLVQYDSYYCSLEPRVAQEYLRNIYLNLEMLKRCNYALTSTDYLARTLQQHKPALLNQSAVGVEDQGWVAHFCFAAGRSASLHPRHQPGATRVGLGTPGRVARRPCETLALGL